MSPVAAGRRERLVAALLRDVGAGAAVLPWKTPRSAEQALGREDRARLLEVRRRLSAAWRQPRPHFAVHEAVSILNPSNRVTVYPGAATAGPTWIVQNARGETTDQPLINQEKMGRSRAYEIDRLDQFSNRPVALGPIVASPRKGGLDPITGVDVMLVPNQLLHQLRMVTYLGNRVALYVGLYRRPSERQFQLIDHAPLFALRPALLEWARMATAIGLEPLGDGALVQTLEAFNRPALLLRHNRPVFANRHAAAMVAQTSAWARSNPRDPSFATCTRLSPGGFDLELVLPRTRFPQDLPPALARVAAAAAQGLSDKQIAELLNLPLTTTRTYVARVLRRLGLHDRRELMRR